jgi:hypothetical protein
MEIRYGGFCSNCFNHADPKTRVVEFPAAWDGPVLESGVSIDELFLCENCIRNACEVLTIDPVGVTVLELEARDARVAAERWKAYAEKLEEGLAVRPEPKAKRKVAA